MKRGIIDLFLEYTQGKVSPEIFRRWAAISLVAGVAEKRVWARTTAGEVYPNLFIGLCARPGIGKDVIQVVQNFYSELGQVRLGADDMSKAALLDNMAKATRLVKWKDSVIRTHYLQVVSSEFTNLMPVYDPPFAGILTKFWDNVTLFKESRRVRDVEQDLEDGLVIENPMINMLIGTQPMFLAGMLPEYAWGQGFLGRMLFVYSDQPVHPNMFLTEEEEDERDARDAVLRGEILSHLKTILQMTGRARFTPEVQQYLAWHQPLQTAPDTSAPTHPRLQNYSTRRNYMLMKLAVVAMLEQDPGTYVITKQHLDTALAWQLEAEIATPKIFANMQSHSDFQLMQELWAYAWEQYAIGGAKPLSSEELLSWISERTSVEKAKRLLDLAEQSGKLIRMAGERQTYIPAKAKQ